LVGKESFASFAFTTLLSTPNSVRIAEELSLLIESKRDGPRSPSLEIVGRIRQAGYERGETRGAWDDFTAYGILLAQNHRNTNEKGLPQSFRQE